MPFKIIGLYILVIVLTSCDSEQIDREKLVSRHNVHLTQADSLNSLTVGNGSFAMTVDVTGLQSFPDYYEKGVPLGLQSEWGWHAFPTERAYDISETDVLLKSHGREVPYARQWPANTEQGKAGDYIRQNPHRVHLAQLGFEFIKKNGEVVSLDEIRNIDQTLNVWTGEIHSNFEIEGVTAEVLTVCNQKADIVGVKVKSKLIEAGRIRLRLNFPTPSTSWRDNGNFYDNKEDARLQMDSFSPKHYAIEREIDNLKYKLVYNTNLDIKDAKSTSKGVVLYPALKAQEWSFTCSFMQDSSLEDDSDFDTMASENQLAWKGFWNSGGIIDFSNVKDERAKELERRMVLSMYLTKVNCGGITPPQETGLTFNSWYGKPHMEMIWWHGVHNPLWGRIEVLEKQVDWYLRNEKKAEDLAKRQGFKGVRWQKMTDPWGGETPSSVGAYLIWQQPHPIYFAELIYGQNTSKEVLDKYADLVESTATFMADFAYYEPTLERYILGPGVIPAQERFKPEETFNPTYELAYWRWALEKAQDWRERLGKERNKKWDEVITGLSPLPQKDGLYLATENAEDSYTNEHFMTDHPSVFGTYGMLPVTDGLDKEVMKATFDKIWTDWQWHDTWGWDFPMTAMTATRLGLPEKAVDALLMPITTNTYLANGHNYQTPRLTIYLPGNGGFLTALGMMAAGTLENPEANQGFPKTWDVKWEGLSKMP
ncbi:hypothetical protein [uncultured Arcticibacterium sp.]|uniref:hypothetical protein n=1 Tax=uncultured Arcticibacterium sp. TaxID=2173042 RepID=UPI0030FC2DEA